MSVSNEIGSPGASERTAVAVLVAIVATIPAILPAAIIGIIYNFFFRFFVGSGSWIPYVDQIGELWFPEMLRGLVIGAIAIWVSRRFFPRANMEAVRLATLAFWAAVIMFVVILGVAMRGLTLELVSVAALVVGYGCGLWMDELS